MKKIIFILIVALLISGSVFAQPGEDVVTGSTNDTDNLTVKLKVDTINKVEWFLGNGPVKDYQDWISRSEDNGEPEDDNDEKTFDASGSAIIVYPSILTNSSVPVTIKIKGNPLTNGGSTINLEASFGEGNKTTWTLENRESYISISETGISDYKRRVFSPALTLSLPTDWAESTGYSTPYQTTLTLEYSTGQ